MEQYFASFEDRESKLTMYAQRQGGYEDIVTGNCWWWLRSPTFNTSYAAVVDNKGLTRGGQYVDKGNIGVRPALWIDLSVLSVEDTENEIEYELLDEVAKDTLISTQEVLLNEKENVFPSNTSALVGDVITFGSYEQDNDLSDGQEPIEWLILAAEENHYLLISKYVLDAQRYNEESEYVTWETCSLREWLNTEFLQRAFSDREKARIETKSVPADRNPNSSANPGDTTWDKVFLLSIPEATQLLSSEEERMCMPTAYAQDHGCYRYSTGGNCWWWLRSPGGNYLYISGIDYVGAVSYGGSFISGLSGVRPALWVNIKSEY